MVRGAEFEFPEPNKIVGTILRERRRIASGSYSEVTVRLLTTELGNWIHEIRRLQREREYPSNKYQELMHACQDKYSSHFSD